MGSHLHSHLIHFDIYVSGHSGVGSHLRSLMIPKRQKSPNTENVVEIERKALEQNRCSSLLLLTSPQVDGFGKYFPESLTEDVATLNQLLY